MDQEFFLEAVRLEAISILKRILGDDYDSKINESQIVVTKGANPTLMYGDHLAMMNSRGRWLLKGGIPDYDYTSLIFRMPQGTEQMLEAHAIKTIGLQLALAVYQLEEYVADPACHPSWFFGRFQSTFEID